MPEKSSKSSSTTMKQLPKKGLQQITHPKEMLKKAVARKQRVSRALWTWSILFFSFAAIVLIDMAALYSFPSSIIELATTFLVITGTFTLASAFTKLSLQAVSNSLTSSIEHKLLVSKMYSTGIHIAALVVILWYLGVTADNIALVLGLATAGIAFALRDIIASFFAWFILLTKNHFVLVIILKLVMKKESSSTSAHFLLSLMTQQKEVKIIRATLFDYFLTKQ